MLARPLRLKKENDFRAIYRRGRAIKGDFIDLRFARNNTGGCRFGFIVGLNVSKKATLRNKIRRRVNEATAGLVGRIKPGNDVLFVAKPKIAEQGQKEIKKDIENVIQKAQLLD
jgi:ribonuclease P protein component